MPCDGALGWPHLTFTVSGMNACIYAANICSIHTDYSVICVTCNVMVMLVIFFYGVAPHIDRKSRTCQIFATADSVQNRFSGLLCFVCYFYKRQAFHRLWWRTLKRMPLSLCLCRSRLAGDYLYKPRKNMQIMVIMNANISMHHMRAHTTLNLRMHKTRP